MRAKPSGALSATGPIAPLYVPGDRPDRFAKALASEADAIIIDLEDAVAPAHKPAARAAAFSFLTQAHDKPIYLRVNDPRSPWFDDDIAALAAAVAESGPAGVRGLTGLRVPKIESAEDVAAVAAALPATRRGAGERPGIELHCLIESARGVEHAYQIATAHPLVAGIALGEADLAGELGVADESGLAWARGRVVVAARAAGLPAPHMSVYPSVADLDGLAASCRTGRGLGFVGRTLIHPRQAPIVLRAFAPTAEQAAAAQAVLDALDAAVAAGSGVAVLADGRFVDRAMERAARRTVALRAALGRRAE
jgi:citrate lyase subunit beta/citryl-CoA lyase